jgi:CRP-like cAMP-binding protein
LNREEYQRQQAIERVDVFRGLSEEEFRTVVRAGKARSYGPDQRVFTAGEDSSEMVVLLRGQMIVTTSSGTILGSIVQGKSLGEMGFFTGRPRSANVTTTVPSSVLVFGREDFQTVMSQHPRIHIKVLSNVIVLLSDRLSGANVQIDDYSATARKTERGAGGEQEVKA